ncbi:uncharacterized protein V6R79_023965 [Siganus canaliculatus]
MPAKITSPCLQGPGAKSNPRSVCIWRQLTEQPHIATDTLWRRASENQVQASKSKSMKLVRGGRGKNK